ncbi:putative quinol monooxygenase [Caulobacter sp. RL271]|jgi:quinol monooxygenase YgiN|uniref:Antibiotic biosynthesis monooxygenase n=1 Tax=Caulobacter segnis TaxID=88688 RepID=A0ABY4ZSD4_9CAUL|nr:putative quinol monooxygenase [Caulobacter segnis]USQ95539.1 antibiotic biosynthesis monooxygenase [Caulobacter segnis]
MIIVLGEVLVAPEHRAAAIAVGLAHCARSRAEPGCLSHDCFIDAANPNRLQFVERWLDLTALRVHFGVPDSAAFVREMQAFVVEPPKMNIFEATEAPRG